ncbi:MAG: hypothetical protein A2821_03470 [Candidatus Magasanikbacteria bacterium RIFCSPHIGHO2_01_FULL_41_23]|uniref:Uncharacterized protein n=1 Tax=Candidatus Magasanikbacteria bacterium RIFCSPLOWO2_01_FULL_40_15 TaxID=1798686 RepID=A0A1F6N3T0_9BACT|nr:MAG: hypothetical protein A2821_03470 [Candidatus Magasanikbacteria bacterium RIFCSPHIGHO2_01_FULL_41_23]OGH67229.1 MAG: hypothetical protein A3C66_01220 [Candidatus Magasanikbacteria bacterium RIFCSPHIGHO2_02_FULL_41_35]OGH74515.1 MAG: hypothetical protein A3F22_02755 [Candidatus Magasanikbacteria bacterium RIFCSPHIGHO2_12_FULL_41_16]OGH78532.1 MAG: hypothetical protein A2983_00480 [Candidatus Magasanikbacteria bacterium RIFCSPLOWO2_01_FULL_40_15]
MSLDPNNLTPNKINLTGRVSQPLRSVLATGKRMMSNGKFIKTMRAKMAETGKMTDRVAKKVALRAAVGVKDLGVTVKKEKTFFGKMQDDGMLSTMYKTSIKNAINRYKFLAGASEVVKNDTKNPANDNVEQIKTEEEENKDQHHRMQKIRDDIEEEKKKKQKREVSATHNYGQDDTGNAVTSISHLNDHSDTSTTQTPFPGSSIQTTVSDPFNSSIDEPKNKLSAGDLVQNAPPTQLD